MSRMISFATYIVVEFFRSVSIESVGLASHRRTSKLQRSGEKVLKRPEMREITCPNGEEKHLT